MIYVQFARKIHKRRRLDRSSTRVDPVPRLTNTALCAMRPILMLPANNIRTSSDSNLFSVDHEYEGASDRLIMNGRKSGDGSDHSDSGTTTEPKSITSTETDITIPLSDAGTNAIRR